MSSHEYSKTRIAAWRAKNTKYLSLIIGLAFKNIVPKAKTSDPFVQIKIGSSSIESKVCFNTLDPEFTLYCDIPLECPSNYNLYIKLFDYDYERLKSN